jgi:hypothetical protein
MALCSAVLNTDALARQRTGEAAEPEGVDARPGGHRARRPVEPSRAGLLAATGSGKRAARRSGRRKRAAGLTERAPEM